MIVIVLFKTVVTVIVVIPHAPSEDCPKSPFKPDAPVIEAPSTGKTVTVSVVVEKSVIVVVGSPELAAAKLFPPMPATGGAVAAALTELGPTLMVMN